MTEIFLRSDLKENRLTGFIILDLVTIFASLVFYDSFGVLLLFTQTVIGIILLSFVEVNHFTAKNFIISLFGILLAFIGVWISKLGYGRFLIYFSLMIHLFVFNQTVLSRKNMSKIYLFATVFLTIFLLLYVKEDGTIFYKFIFSFYNVKINPNMYAFFVFLAVIYLMNYLSLSFSRKKHTYIVFGIIVAIVSIYFTGARTTLIAMLLFLLICLLCRRRFMRRLLGSQKNIKIWLISGMFCILLISAVYVWFFQQYGGGFTVLGKYFFSGREEIWSDIFQSLAGGGWLFGYHNDVPSAHNSLLSVWINLGIIPLICLITMFFQIKSKKPDYCVVISSIVGIIAVLFVCAFETVLNDVHSYLIIALLLLNKIKTESYEEIYHDTQDHSLLLVWKKPKS